eukprot:791463-Pleurochrysis_carterae.AAC.1
MQLDEAGARGRCRAGDTQRAASSVTSRAAEGGHARGSAKLEVGGKSALRHLLERRELGLGLGPLLTKFVFEQTARLRRWPRLAGAKGAEAALARRIALAPLVPLVVTSRAVARRLHVLPRRVLAQRVDCMQASAQPFRAANVLAQCRVFGNRLGAIAQQRHLRTNLLFRRYAHRHTLQHHAAIGGSGSRGEYRGIQRRRAVLLEYLLRNCERLLVRRRVRIDRNVDLDDGTIADSQVRPHGHLTQLEGVVGEPHPDGKVLEEPRRDRMHVAAI